MRLYGKFTIKIHSTLENYPLGRIEQDGRRDYV